MPATSAPRQPDPASGSFAYTGRDNLEAMAEAVNYNRFLIDAVVRWIGPRDRVLDFGAGAGTYAEMLRERGVVPECLEPDGPLQETLRGKGFTVVSDDAPRGAYDVIYTLNVLEHIKNDQEAVERLAELLRPGGRLVVYVPALESLFTSMDVKVEHYRRYRRKQLERILRNAGLDVVESSYSDPVGVAATLAFKVFGNDDGDISVPALKFYDRVAFPVSRALHPLLGKVTGKNVLVVAERPR